MQYGADTMQDLECELVTVETGNALPGQYAQRECVVYVVAGKGNLVIGPDGGQQWRYPLDAFDVVWIPAGTVFSLINDGIGNLEVSRYLYRAS